MELELFSSESLQLEFCPLKQTLTQNATDLNGFRDWHFIGYSLQYNLTRRFSFPLFRSVPISYALSFDLSILRAAQSDTFVV